MPKLQFNGKSYGPFTESIAQSDTLELYFDKPKTVVGLEKELYSIIPKKWTLEDDDCGSTGYALLESISRDKIVLKLRDKSESSAIKVHYVDGVFKINLKGLYLELNEKEAHNLAMEILSAFTVMSKVNNPTGASISN